eukprot:m.442250 g.442250  ORF g.442250 m.442250 type:complete len:378 (+) comp18774_c0_seq1:161-1294(+)
MGIKGLTKLIADRAPDAIREGEIGNYFSRKIAVDASMALYQFLVAVRSEGSNLTNEDGETTSHLVGMFYRTIRMITNGLKPVYVFDGKPPEMKSGELAKRTAMRQKTEASLADAQQKGDTEEVDKFTRRMVKVTPQHNEDCMTLLKLMGVPFVKAPCEAEAQCAALTAAGKVFATGTEDMDALTFGSTVLLRHLSYSEARKMPIREVNLAKVLEGLGLTMPEFIDLCILLGCDYCDSIRGIGPVKAFDLIKEHKCIEKILKVLDKKKYPVPEDWPFARARELFVTPEVTPAAEVDFRWTEPDIDGLVEFMCKKNGFDEKRILSGAEKLKKARTGKQQGRLDSFFSVLPSSGPKRKAPTKESAKSKKKKVSGKGKPRK